MSLATASPTVDLRTPSSPSRSSMALKSAGPTPTMMIDIGSRDARTMASRVWSKSVISPSVRIRRTEYCCRKASTAFTESLFIKIFCQCLWLCVFFPHWGSVTLCAGGSNVIDNRREICWSREFQLRQSHPVGFNNPLNPWKERGRAYNQEKNMLNSWNKKLYKDLKSQYPRNGASKHLLKKDLVWKKDAQFKSPWWLKCRNNCAQRTYANFYWTKPLRVLWITIRITEELYLGSGD